MIVDIEKIMEMDKRYRTNFVNSLSGFKSLNLAGTIDQVNKQTNLAPVSSVIHVGANPPLMGMLMRPNTVPRHTLENIVETGKWTLNHVNQQIFVHGHQTSARYPENVSEFDAVGLSAEYLENFSAPFVREAHIKIGLSLQERVDLKSNGTHFLVGRIELIQLPEIIVEEDGFIDIEKVGTLTVSGLDSYHSTRQINRLPYAKCPDPSTSEPLLT